MCLEFLKYLLKDKQFDSISNMLNFEDSLIYFKSKF